MVDTFDHYFGNPIIDWSAPFRNPFPQDETFVYDPTPDIEPDVHVYRNYDPAVAAFLGSFLFTFKQIGNQLVMTTKHLPIVFATPDRAFSEAIRVLCPGATTDLKRPPLPIGSLDNSADPSLEAGRMWTTAPIRYMGHSYDRTEMLQMPFPIPYAFPYTLSIWANTKAEHDAYRHEIVKRFRKKERFLEVRHKDGFGLRCVAFTLESVANAFELAPGAEDRTLRSAYNFVLHGWMTRAPWTVKTVLKMVEEYGVTSIAHPDVADAEIVPGEEVVVFDHTGFPAGGDLNEIDFPIPPE